MRAARSMRRVADRARARLAARERSDAAPPSRRREARGEARHSIAAGILLSRLLGLVRQTLIAQLPRRRRRCRTRSTARSALTNFLQNLFGEGALSASFIPVYAQRAGAAETIEEADRIAGAVGAILALVVRGARRWSASSRHRSSSKLVVGGFTARSSSSPSGSRGSSSRARASS